MKKILYLCSSLVLVSSFTFVGGRSYAAHLSNHTAAAMVNVRLCSSTPVGIPANAHLSRGIFHGAELATKQWRARFKKAGLKLLSVIELDYARADGSGNDSAKERTNALQCVGRKDTFGYVGTLNSSIAKITEPITNSSGMAMISPSNSAVDLTDPKQRQTYEPLTFSHKLKYTTYYRTVTTDALQGPAGAIFMKKSLHAKTYFLADDGQTYGVGLAQHIDSFVARGKLTMTKVGSGRVDTTSSASISTTSDAIASQVASKNPSVMYCACNLENAYLLARDARRKGFNGSIMGGDAIFDPSWIKNVGEANTKDDYASSFGPDPATASKSFRKAYNAAYPGFGLGPYDATSYDAANIILQGIFKAKKAGTLTKGSLFQRRAAVLPYISSVKWKGSIGLTTFDRNGDTTNRIISIYHVKGAQWVFKQLAPKLPGYLQPTQ